MTVRTARYPRVALAAALLVIAAACTSTESETTGGADDSDEPTESPVESEPRYADAGPYEVGITTLTLDDGRAVEVFYPAAAGSTDVVEPATYVQTDPIPPELMAGLPAPPPDLDLSVELPAAREVPAADDGPFPLVLFSHGAGGWRGVYGYQLSGLASWGFVVASIDYPEYGLVASFTGGSAPEAMAGVADVARSTVDALEAASADPASLLAGSVDATRVGAAGHSAGGGTMFRLLDDDEIGAIVGWAPAIPAEETASTTPTLIVAAGDDIAITPEEATAAYESLNPTKRLVVIEEMGHNGFGDSCLAIRGGTDLIGIAQDMGIPIPERLLELGRNGCEDGDLQPQVGWAVTQHFTVAHLRAAFGIDEEPVGLGEGVADSFEGVEVDYRYEE